MECKIIGHKGSFNNYVDKKKGRGVSKKSTLVHPGGRGVSGCPRGQKFAKSYRRIMAYDYEKLHLLFSSDLRMQYIEDD